MKTQLISTSYFNSREGPSIILYGRQATGEPSKNVITGFRPYFYVLPKNFEVIKSLLDSFPEVTEYYENYKYMPIGFQQQRTEVLQVYVNRPGDVPKLRDILRSHPEVVDCYEADILYATARFLTDNDIFGMGWIEINNNDVKPLHNIIDNAPIKILGFDIEVNPPIVGIPLAENDQITIISISFNDSETLVLVAKPGQDTPRIKYFPDEFWMLSTFMDIVQDYNPDIITMFNGSSFDFPYIEKRLNILGIENNMGRDNSPFAIKEFGSKKEVNIVGRATID